MAEQNAVDFSDLVKTTAPNQNIQDLVETLQNYINVDAIVEKEGCSKVEGYDESKALKEIWNEFKDNFRQIKGLIPSITSLSKGVRLLVFQAKWSSFYHLVEEDDWIVLMPVIISGSIEATLHDYTTRRQTTITLETKTEIIIAGRCSMWLGPESKVVCVVLCIGEGDKGKRRGEGDKGKRRG